MSVSEFAVAEMKKDNISERASDRNMGMVSIEKQQRILHNVDIFEHPGVTILLSGSLTFEILAGQNAKFVPV